MKIYTSYYAKCRKIPHTITCISIAGKAPAGYRGIEYKVLAPKKEFFMQWKENHDNDYYIKCFNEQVLSHLNPVEVYNRLEELSCGQDIVLICYEKSGDFCHRHLVADWLSKNLGIEVKEWTEDEVQTV